jgi:hypothetical protein
MMPFGFLFQFLGLRVGHYGPKLAALLLDDPSRPILFVQHIVIGWFSALPLLVILLRFHRAVSATAMGMAYGFLYYVLVNSLALPLFFGDPTPWRLGFNVIYPSLVVHLAFGACIGLTARKFVAHEAKLG